MLLGLILLVASWGINLQGWVIMYAWSLFIYGKNLHHCLFENPFMSDIL